MKEKLKFLAFSLAVPSMLVLPTMASFASDSGTVTVPAIDIQSIVTGAVDTMKGNMLVVIASVTGAAVAIAGISVACSFLIKKIKGLKAAA